MRIGFLFNHDQIHQVAHSLPTALALARSGVDAEIIAATTNDRISAEVVRLGGGLVGDRIELVKLGLRRRTSRFAEATFDNLLPATKLLIYRDNLEFFRSLDVLVVTETTSLILKTQFGLTRPQIICIPHGAGDRAIGFQKLKGRFDHMLVAGPKIRDRMVSDGGVDPETISIVGYPKFDLADGDDDNAPVFDRNRPVVLYNPHVSPHLSSWYPMGQQVLDWFAGQEKYQLIFAPHVMMFERRFVLSIDKLRFTRPGKIQERHRQARHIHVDLGSRASTTMAYTQRADIYLGDVSSQVYEFLLNPRPCVFLNPRRFDWRDDPNFAHWGTGPVIETAAELGPALDRAIKEHAVVHRPVQRELFDYTFSLTEEPSSVRAARAIAALAGLASPPAPLREARRLVLNG